MQSMFACEGECNLWVKFCTLPPYIYIYIYRGRERERERERELFTGKVICICENKLSKLEPIEEPVENKVKN